MCGIAGIVAPSGNALAGLDAMSAAIDHRGPDGEGYAVVRPDMSLEPGTSMCDGPAIATLAHRRLSIIDVSDASSQPMTDEERSVALSFNGEVYNYLELRRELERRGHRFRTEGDTEVLLRSYLEWGAACTERLVGMWAFALVDLRRRVVVLSRDRFGIKPLYWCLRDGRLLFASEIKAIVAGLGASPPPRDDVFARFVLTGSVDVGPATFFSDIEQLPAATTAEIALGERPQMRCRSYWSLPTPSHAIAADGGVAAFRQLFERSVAQHGRSDVAVGTCLSGGLDSSSIVTVAAQLRGRGEMAHMTHLGFGYEAGDAEVSERGFMDVAARAAQIDMTHVTLDDEQLDALVPPLIAQQDEPFGSLSIAAQWAVFEAAHAAGIKVMLDGQGADESLAGYTTYVATAAGELLRHGRLLRYASFSRAFAPMLGRAPLTARDALAAILPEPARRMYRRLGGGTATAAHSLLSDEAASAAAEVAAATGRGSLDEHLRDDLLRTNLPALLRFEDRNSMAHSIEARVPFLDHRLVEYAFALPREELLADGETKRVLRRAMRGTVPDAILDRRDKIGFRADPGATQRFIARHRAALSEPETDHERRWLDSAASRKVLQGPITTTDQEFLAWRLVCAKLWLRMHWP